MPVNGNCCIQPAGQGYIVTISGAIAGCADYPYTHPQADIDKIQNITLYMPGTSGTGSIRGAALRYAPSGSMTLNQFTVGSCIGTPSFITNSTVGYFGVNVLSVTGVPLYVNINSVANSDQMFRSSQSSFTSTNMNVSNEATSHTFATGGTLTIRAVNGQVGLNSTFLTFDNTAQNGTLTITALPGSDGNTEWVAGVGAGGAVGAGPNRSNLDYAITPTPPRTWGGYLTLLSTYGTGSGSLVFSLLANTTGGNRDTVIYVNGAACVVRQTG